MVRSPISDAGKLKSGARFHVPQALSLGAEVRMPERAARHIAVLRLQKGEEVALFDGSGGEFRGVLARLGRAEAVVRITGHLQQADRESPLDITLAQCIAAGDRMDWVMQKATELGVHSLVPLISERAVVRLSAERSQRKLEHWRNITIAACEQCGRNRLPVLSAPIDLHSWLAAGNVENEGKGGSDSLRLLLSPQGEHDLATLSAKPPSAITLLTGPEGGLAEHEQVAAIRHGFMPVRLGPRILRTETAPLAAIAALQALWGDFGTGSR